MQRPQIEVAEQVGPDLQLFRGIFQHLISATQRQLWSDLAVLVGHQERQMGLVGYPAQTGHGQSLAVICNLQPEVEAVVERDQHLPQDLQLQ